MKSLELLHVCIISSFVSVGDCHINGRGTGDIDRVHTLQASIHWLFCLLICPLEAHNTEIIAFVDLCKKKKKFLCFQILGLKIPMTFLLFCNKIPKVMLLGLRRKKFRPDPNLLIVTNNSDIYSILEVKE